MKVMKVRYILGQADAVADTTPDGPLVVALSDFDGVHGEHVALARQALTLAATTGGRVVALLPWPSPAGGDNSPAPRLTTLEERIELLRALGLFDTLLIAPAPAEERTPAEAVAWLQTLGEIRGLVVERTPSGAVSLLWPEEASALAEEAGIALMTVGSRAEGQAQESERASQPPGARIAALIEEGHLTEATAALGYPYTVTGEVIGGDRRGRLLGYPTANLRPEPSKVIPANGIYAARVGLPGETGPRRPAVVSIGVRPTFGEGARRQIEAHLLDAAFDLYGLFITVEFVAWLRPELRFESIEALIAQMDTDSDESRRLLGVK